MIIQSGNNPIEILFDENMENAKVIRISIWQDNQMVKLWEKEELTIENEKVIANITQEESADLVEGTCELEIKWLNENDITEFARTVLLNVVKKNDKEKMVGVG